MLTTFSSALILIAVAQQLPPPDTSDGRETVITFVGGQDRYADTFHEGLRTWQRRLG